MYTCLSVIVGHGFNNFRRFWMPRPTLTQARSLLCSEYFHTKRILLVQLIQSQSSHVVQTMLLFICYSGWNVQQGCFFYSCFCCKGFVIEMYHMCQSCPKPIQCFIMVNGDRNGPSHNMKLLLLYYITTLDCYAVKLLLRRQTWQVVSKNSMCCHELRSLPWFRWSCACPQGTCEMFNEIFFWHLLNECRHENP